MIHGLYLHMPFCAKRCLYCGFTSYAGKQDRIPEYVAALLRDLELSVQDLPAQSRPLTSVYFGGGTPSLLEPGQIRQILKAVSRHFILDPGTEISLEANPGTVDLCRLQGFHSAGVGRLSLGLQAAQDHLLSRLGRIHSAADGERAFTWARQAGFKNISVDLMFGLPGQTMDEWLASLQWVKDLEPEHVSFYGLSVEKGTIYFELAARHQLDLPGEDGEADMYESGIAFLEQAGYQQYEISNFSKPGFRSRHNCLYWENRPVLGLGASACSYIDGVRVNRTRDLEEYFGALAQNRRPVELTEELKGRQALGEEAFLKLRMTEGISLADWQQRTGSDFLALFGSEVEVLCRQGLLSLNRQNVRLTRRGLPLANEVFQAFV
jgi:oxygen-independent coproporphyrinogen III oxidase